MSSWSNPSRNDAPILPNTYLRSKNPEVVDSILWPVPILALNADKRVSIGTRTVQPGDVLELIDGNREDFYLVVDLINQSKRLPELLVFSSNCDQYQLLKADHINQPPNPHLDSIDFEYNNECYAHHSSVVNPVDDNPVATLTTVDRSPAMVDTPFGEHRKPDAWYPYSNPPEITSPVYPPSLFEPKRNEDEQIDTLRDQLFCGKANGVLAQMPDNSVHTWITSPPYPGNMRDYDTDEQMLTDDTDRYLKQLIKVIAQACRVLREDGLGWLVLDDGYENGAYRGVSDQLIAKLKQHDDLTVISSAVWAKPTGMPDPANNRLSHTHERLIAISPSTEYYFDKQALQNETDVRESDVHCHSDRQLPEDLKDNYGTHDAMFSVELIAPLIRASTPKTVCGRCGAPYEPTYDIDLWNLPPNRDQAQRAIELAKEANLTDEHIEAVRAEGLTGSGQAARTQTGAGNNRDKVQRLAAEARNALGSYAQEFHSAQKTRTGFEQTCDCSTETIPPLCLDPFIGSGTTAIAAKADGRDYVGIDTNKDYLTLARARLDGTHNSRISRWG